MEPEANAGSSVAKTVIWIVVLLLIVGGFILYGGKKGVEEQEAAAVTSTEEAEAAPATEGEATGTMPVEGSVETSVEVTQ